MAEKITYIYGLVDPRDGSVHYVGKSNNPRARARQHVWEALRDGPTNAKKEWLIELHSEGLKPEAQVLAECPYEQYGQYEQSIMDELREAGAELYNIAPGGSGGGVPGDTWGDNPERREWVSQRSREMWADPEFRKEYAAKSLEYWSDPENRQRASEIQQRVWADNDETKDRISKMQLENWRDPEYREAVTQSNIEAWSDPKLLEKHAERAREMWQDPEYRERVIAAINDPEMQAKRREAMAETWDEDKRAEQSERMKEMWQDPEIRAKHAAGMEQAAAKISDAMTEHFKDPKAREHLSQVQTERMADPARRDHLSDVAKSLWDDQEYREKQLRSRNRGKLRSDVSWAAEQLGVKKVTVYKYCNQGRLGQKIDGSWVITEEDVKAFKTGR